MSSNIHESRQGEFRTATIAMTVLATAFVALRFLARWKKGLKIGIDDFGILVSLGFLFADAGFNLALVYYGMGLHAQALPAENLVIIAKVLMAYECVYSATIAVIKIAILLLYIRIFPTRSFRIAAYILGAITIAWAISIVCVSVFQCTPVAKSWDPMLSGSCINLKGSFIGNAVPNILTDVAILSLPVRMVWKLQAPVAYRVGVIGLFMLGSFVVFCSIYRFTTLFKFQPDDTAWTLGDACTWCVIECASGIISGCMPTLRPLFMMVSSTFGSRGSPGTGSRSGSRRIRAMEPQGTDANKRTNQNPTFRPTNEVLAKNDVRLDVSLPDEADGDEVPLNNYSIRVHRDVTWQESVEDGSIRAWR
ncbi:hypothetical protein BDV06DRAFT_233191 [Aspergillus oleicola]